MVHRDPTEIKRLNVEIPLTLYNRFIEILPFRGELTAFIRRAMEKAIEEGNPYKGLEKVGKVIERIEDRRE